MPPIPPKPPQQPPTLPSPTRPENLSLFTAPWCHTLLTHPSLLPFHLPNRRPPPPFYATCSNTMFARTLWTDTALRATTSFLLPLPSAPIYPFELHTLYALGDGVDGMTGRAHGGLISLLLDQCLGLVAAQAYSANTTAKLEVEFRRPVATPGIVLVRARVERVQGNRCWVVGTVEDGEGKVFADGRALMVRSRASAGVSGGLSGTGESAGERKAKL